VQDYNTYIGLFPSSIVASLSGFTRDNAYFRTEEGARQAPKVNFGGQSTQQPAPAPNQ
jgi:LemA protein